MAPSAVYTTGAPVLRSSAHRAVYSKSRKGDAGPVAPRGALPDALRETEVFEMPDDGTADALRVAVARLLRRAGPAVGTWPEDKNLDPSRARLEDFRVPVGSLADTKAGSCDAAQAHLADLVAADEGEDGILPAFDRLVEDVVVPRLRRRLVLCGAIADEEAARFYVQRPPTLRLQPGPSTRHVRPHRDCEYGHQDGEVNFWLPLTDPSETRVTLEVESKPDAGDYAPLNARVGHVGAFHGTSLRHFAPANPTTSTRCSLDFRVGVEGWFDPAWSMRGTKADHSRREIRA